MKRLLKKSKKMPVRETLTEAYGEQAVLPDDCQFGDNDLCFVEA